MIYDTCGQIVNIQSQVIPHINILEEDEKNICDDMISLAILIRSNNCNLVMYVVVQYIMRLCLYPLKLYKNTSIY